MKNYSLESHKESHELERLFNEEYKEYVVWNNANWNGERWDNKADIPDFNCGKYKLELQRFNFTHKFVITPYRRFFEVDNLRGIYSTPKDISNTIHVLYDGTMVAWAPLDIVRERGTHTTEWGGKRVDWEQAYVTTISAYKREGIRIQMMLWSME